MTRSEALVIAKEALVAEVHAGMVRSRLAFLRNGHSFETVEAIFEIQADMVAEDLHASFAELAAWLTPPRPALRVIHGGAV